MKLRTWIAVAGLAAAAFAAQAAETVEVYKSPYCGCCQHWVEYMKANGFEVKVTDVDNVDAARQRLGMPQKYGACHSAKVGGYLVEGHVPAEDVRKLLAQKPKALGIAVPAMPPGSPGMPSDKPVPYDTLLVQHDGSSNVFARH